MFLKAESLTKFFGSEILSGPIFSDLSLEIREGEFAAIIGPSGSGKSTLLHILGLMDRPSEGRIFLMGSEMVSKDEAAWDKVRRTSVGFIFQNFNLLSALTVAENVEVSLFGLDRNKWSRRKRVTAALEAVGMNEHANKFPAQLSGGMRQRVAIARSIVHEPELVVADEPTASLDQKNAQEVVALLKDLQKNRRLTIIMASHDETTYRQADRIIRLEGGKLREIA